MLTIAPRVLMPLIETLMFVHIGAGLIAIVAGTATLLAKPKGGTVHRVGGQVFLWSFLVLAVTAAGLLIFRWNPFFFGLSVLSFYLAFSGWRVLKRKKLGRSNEQSVAPLDWIAAGVTIATGIGCVGFHLTGGFGDQSEQAAAVLGTLSFAALTALYDLWRFAFPEELFRRMPRVASQAWFMEHLTKQSGAFIALLCAFSGTVLRDTELEPAIAQTTPAIAGTPILLYVAFRYWQKIRREKPVPPFA